MTQNQVLVALERFRMRLHKLSHQLADDHEFWPEYAERANAIEASCPIELRDYARGSILRSVNEVARLREARK